MLMPSFDYDGIVNPFLWGLSNLIVLYVCIVMFFYVLGHFIFFKWEKNQGGRLVMGFTSSLLGVVALISISLFTGAHGLFDYPPDVLVWRPALRTIVYTLVALTTTKLALTLIDRWKKRQRFQGAPPRTKEPISKPDEDTTPKPRMRHKAPPRP